MTSLTFLPCFRFYSISSSSRVYQESIHITGVVVEYTTKTGRLNKGVATTWLKPMIPEPDDDKQFRVPIYVRRSQFRLPNRPQTPVIMIGPGTGLAPFRGFIQERAWQKEQVGVSLYLPVVASFNNAYVDGECGRKLLVHVEPRRRNYDVSRTNRNRNQAKTM